MAQSPQIVIYRPAEDQEPTWQFYSMPMSIVGGGRTLEEARKQYFEAFNFALEESDYQPEVVREYVEREIQSLGIWIRTPLDLPTADRSFTQVASQIVQYPDEDREWFYRHITAGGDPVVVPSFADAPLSSIYDQMTPYDSLIVVMGTHDGENLRFAWIVINGMASERTDDDASTQLESLGLTPTSSLGEVLAGALAIFGDRPAELLASV